MNKLIFYLLSVLFVFYSCSDKLFAPDEPVPEPEEQYVQIAVDVNVDTTSLSTKTYMTDDGTAGRVKWSSTDKIYLFSSYDAVAYESGLATNISSDGSKATFVFSVSEDNATMLNFFGGILYYGKKELISVSKGGSGLNFSFSLPANQTHAGTNCFNEFENIAFGYCKKGAFGTGNMDCDMHNAFGILKVPVALNEGLVDDIRYIRLTDKTSGDAHYLAGTFDIAVDTLGIPTMEHHQGTGGDSRTIEKYIPSSIKLSDNPYVYFLVPPGTLFGTGGLGLAVYTDKGYYGNKSVTPKSSTASINRSTITKINISSFKKAPYPTPDQTSANSYIFAATAGVASFPAAYKGNGYQGNGIASGDSAVVAESNGITYNSDYYAEIMWQTKCNGETLLAAEVIDSPVYYNSTSGPCISFHKSGVAGNALIALRNPGKKVEVVQLDKTTKEVDEVIWSWHVWITSDTPSGVLVTGQDGNSFTIMDRNVGALYATPDHLSQFHGLAYQYGRKDPFMGSRYTITQGAAYEAYASIYPPTGIWTVASVASDFELSVNSPNVRYMGDNAWCMSNTNVGWGSPSGNTGVVFPKTLVDPCPVGWKVVSEKNVVSVLGYASPGVLNKPTGEVVTSGSGYAFKLTNGNSPVYIPAGGASVSTEAIDGVGTSARVWGATYDKSASSTSTVHFNAFHMNFSLSSTGFNLTSSGIAMKSTMPVRCEKWTEPGSTSNSSISGAPSLVRSAECQEEEELEVVYID